MGEIKYNTGLLIDQRETDYILGSSPVEKEILNPGLDWEIYVPEHETQARRFYDTMSCVTYSATDCLEYLFNHAIQHERISQEDINWLDEKGYFKNGMINFNERFTAILGGTTRTGAYQYKVGDAIRKHGLVPQDMVKFPDLQEDYFKCDFTKEVYDLGKEFIERFPINYQWARDIKEALKYGPVQVCVYFMNGEGILCPTRNPQHAIVAINATDDYVKMDESYSQQFKKYCYKAIYSPMLYTINFKKNNMILKKEDGNPDIWLIIESNKTKINISDMPSFIPLNQSFQEVRAGSLDKYKENGSYLWIDRKIN